LICGWRNFGCHIYNIYKYDLFKSQNLLDDGSNELCDYFILHIKLTVSQNQNNIAFTFFYFRHRKNKQTEKDDCATYIQYKCIFFVQTKHLIFIISKAKHNNMRCHQQRGYLNDHIKRKKECSCLLYFNLAD
jgi:hypothetical protein